MRRAIALVPGAGTIAVMKLRGSIIFAAGVMVGALVAVLLVNLFRPLPGRYEDKVVQAGDFRAPMILRLDRTTNEYSVMLFGTKGWQNFDEARFGK